MASLAAATDRPELMRAENLSVAAAFDLSYQDLSPGQQRLFRRLGLIPGPTFDAYAAAALDGASLGEARRQLDELYDQHLITEPALGRYQLHDLLREHARALAAADDQADSRRRSRAGAGLLPVHRPSRRPALRPPGQRVPPPAARQPVPAGPGPVYARAVGRLAGSRAREPARRRGLRRHPRPLPACRRDTRRDWRLPGRPRSLGSVRRPPPKRAGRSAPGRRPARRGRRAWHAGRTAAGERELPGRRRQPGPGTGAVPRYR